jgi:hypothetical protein
MSKYQNMCMILRILMTKIKYMKKILHKTISNIKETKSNQVIMMMKNKD